MTTSVQQFYSSIKDAAKLTQSERIDSFAYFLQERSGHTSVSPIDIAACFEQCSLAVPSFIAQHLSKGTQSKPRKYIKAAKGYRIERHAQDVIAGRVGPNTQSAQISSELQSLGDDIPNGLGKEWFQESLACFSVEAYRATIVMIWLYTLDHLFSFILAKHLAAFNEALLLHPDQKAAKKAGVIATRDQFTLLGEDMFVELCRTSGVISPDVKRILIEKLGVRNSAAHPSGIKLTRNKAVEFAEDLLRNVVLKYSL